MAARFYLITGCSGGGKSTLLAALAKAGFATVPEPGRRIVAEELAGKGAALPWVDPVAFAQRALRMAREDLDQARARSGPVFFDRGLLDAAVALHHLQGVPVSDTLGPTFPYATPVIFAPPWHEIFEQDAARRHGFDDALAEARRIRVACDTLGLPVHTLAKAPVAARVSEVLTLLERH